MSETKVGVRLGAEIAGLTDAMVLPAGAAVPPLLEPRAQPQIVFLMRDRLAGPGVTAPAALAAVGSVLGGVEVAADGDGRFVTGPLAVAPGGLDLSLEACLLEVDGEIVDSAAAAAVGPAEALARAANELGRARQAVEPGWLVLTGGLTAPVAVRPGMSLAVHFTHLGSIFLSSAPASIRG